MRRPKLNLEQLETDLHTLQMLAERVLPQLTHLVARLLVIERLGDEGRKNQRRIAGAQRAWSKRTVPVPPELTEKLKLFRLQNHKSPEWMARKFEVSPRMMRRLEEEGNVVTTEKKIAKLEFILNLLSNQSLDEEDAKLAKPHKKPAA